MIAPKQFTPRAFTRIWTSTDWSPHGVELVSQRPSLQGETSRSNAIVVMGCGSRAAEAAAELQAASASRTATARPLTVHVAGTPTEAATYIRGSSCIQVVVVGRAIPAGPVPANARGRRPPVVTVEQALGRVLLTGGAGELALAAPPLPRRDERLYLASKRTLDVILAFTFGLVVMLLLPILALLIKLDSPGSVMYSQIRVGLNGRLFRIYKFRTMRQDSERDGAVWAESNDPRTTRLGRFLRATRIDELPQLWNVLTGEMTFVGPRPERPEFTSLLEQELPAYGQRHLVKPGLTGWAQVCFRYANCLQSARTKLEYDLYYVKHASLALDLSILARTVMVVLLRRGL